MRQRIFVDQDPAGMLLLNCNFNIEQQVAGWFEINTRALFTSRNPSIRRGEICPMYIFYIHPEGWCQGMN
jgi:hypothetical protein